MLQLQHGLRYPMKKFNHKHLTLFYKLISANALMFLMQKYPLVNL